MSAFSFRLFFTIFYIITCTSQTLCIWNTVSDSNVNNFDHLNGEYVASGTQQGKTYYVKNAGLCSSSYYLQYIWDGEYNQNWWAIYDHLDGSQYIYQQPYCENPVPNNPWECSAGWFTWNPQRRVDYMTIALGKCPSLTCDQMILSNSGVTECNKAFTRYTLSGHNNVFKSYDNTYLFFNQHTFKWYCSNANYADQCGDDNSFFNYVRSNNDGWNDVIEGNSFNTILSNGNTTTFSCIATSNPSTAPTLTPTSTTNVPTYDTLNPSNTPSQLPTLLPSYSPTYPPNDSPSISPTNIPSANPSIIPTKTPSTSSTNIPTKTPTNIPTNIPTKTPTKTLTKTPTNIPTKTPSISPTNIPTHIPSIVPSNNPSNVPSNTPTNIPSYIPSMSPTVAPTKESVRGIGENTKVTDTQSEEYNINDNSKGFFENSNSILLLILICCCIIIILCCAFVIIFYKVYKRTYINDIKTLEMTNASKSEITIASTSDINVDNTEIIEGAVSNTSITTTPIQTNTIRDRIGSMSSIESYGNDEMKSDVLNLTNTSGSIDGKTNTVINFNGNNVNRIRAQSNPYMNGMNVLYSSNPMQQMGIMNMQQMGTNFNMIQMNNNRMMAMSMSAVSPNYMVNTAGNGEVNHQVTPGYPQNISNECLNTNENKVDNDNDNDDDDDTNDESDLYDNDDNMLWEQDHETVGGQETAGK